MTCPLAIKCTLTAKDRKRRRNGLTVKTFSCNSWFTNMGKSRGDEFLRKWLIGRQFNVCIDGQKF